MGTLIVVTGLMGQLCGDCNGDGRVLVAELVRAVHNALSTADECEECTAGGCDGGVCLEFPEADGISCAIAICFQSEMQVVRCVHRFHETTDRCFDGVP